MKKFTAFLPALVLAGMVSCTRQAGEALVPEVPASQGHGMVTQLIAKVPDFDATEATKSTLNTSGVFGWINNDKIGFIPANVAAGTVASQNMFYIQDASTEPRFVANGWGLLREATYYSYFPYDESNSVSAVSVNYDGQSQSSNGNSDHLGAYDYLHTIVDVPKNGDVEVEYHHIGTIARFLIKVPHVYSSAHFTRLTLSTLDNVFCHSGVYNPCQGTVALTSTVKSGSFQIDLGTGSGISCTNDTLKVYAMMYPTQWAGKQITYTLDIDGTPALSGTFNPSKNQEAGKRYKYTSAVGAIDLSLGETANCYVVSGAGYYKFRADVKGNSNNSVGTPNCAYLVWETANTTSAPARNSIITDVQYEDGYVYFSTPETFKKGNALIALLDAAPTNYSSVNGHTLWSWHIWCTDAPANNTYAAGKVFMDRNLGALANSPSNATSIGLLYQWGRPAPMNGAAAYSTTSAKTVSRLDGTTGSVPVASDSQTTTANAMKNPIKYYGGVSDSRHWSSAGDLTLWGSTKTMYDPCPKGYKVPDSFTGFGYTSASNGYYMNCGGTGYFWPMTGMVGYSFDTNISYTGNNASYWTTVASDSYSGTPKVGEVLNFNSTLVNTKGISYIVSGNPVRCQKI